jgi:hypothetical protein
MSQDQCQILDRAANVIFNCIYVIKELQPELLAITHY